MSLLATWLALWVLMSPSPLPAAEEGEDPDTLRVEPSSEEESARRYTTREERRESGLKHRITRWLTVSDLLEVEAGHQVQERRDPTPDTTEGEVSATAQLGLEIDPSPWAKGEAIFELEHSFEGEPVTGTVDEATVAFTVDDFDLEVGKIYVPFGEYFSHFVSGPILEFGETRGTGACLSWAPADRLDLSAYAYDGKAELAGGGEEADWGFAAQASPVEEVNLGLSYLSDLADSQEELLDEYDDRYAERVDAVSGYADVQIDAFMLTGEFVQALDSFKELAPDRDRPGGWNVELAYYPDARFEGALRLEGSREREGSPRLQAGIALSWLAAKRASVTVEYLQGDFEGGMGEVPGMLETVRHVGALLGVVF